MLSLYIKAIGITAPGINNWHEAEKLFRIEEPYVLRPVAKKLETLLPANERRRATRVTQLALSAAQQIGKAEELNQCLQIFSSSNGDLTTFNQISLALDMDGHPVSPTRFHNSVHNAPAGYWSIATQSQTPSTSITAYTDSLAAGLLEAAVQLNAGDNEQHRDCLLVCYDEISPVPFYPEFNITEEFSCALRLSLSADNALAKLELTLGNGTKSMSRMSDDTLEQLRLSNPQAMVLPLLDAVAQLNAEQQAETITLPYFEQGMSILVSPLKYASDIT
ncbi:MAG: beta-ketoacyl synthase chain length factor [Gammaproteobacteria bacterium]|nr:beta-ketoacyl synthase chain length factor [Gammaproteobacteria bacterium]